MSGSRSAYTRMRILEAATQLFATKGDKASLRQITAQAQVNVSAVNYHFGSREGLISAVYKHQVEALKQAQVESLEQLESEISGPIPPGRLVEAYFRPLIQQCFNPCSSTPGRDPGTLLRTLVRRDNFDVVTRFQAAFARSMPDVPEPELMWRLLFMYSAVSCALSGTDSFSRELTSPQQVPLTAEQLIERIVPFLIGGLLAPLSFNPGINGSHYGDTDRMADASA